MRILLPVVIGLVSATSALAASDKAANDKPIQAPPAAWVHQAAFPADTASKGDAPIRLLLQDQQTHFADGVITKYQETVFRIQTPQGLGTGSISLPWDPALETLTVHKIQIRRGDKIIDILANQSFTVMRREQNLEDAVLDGVLTANIQPEGLQVGDIIDFATSVTHADPAMGGHYESIAGGWGALPIGDARLSADWPKGTDVSWRARGQLPPLKKASAGGVNSASLVLSGMQPVVAPLGAPSRYNELRMVEFSDFKDWAALSALMAPLYVKAATLAPDAKLDAEIATIAAASPDPKARATAALKLVQDRVRYVFLGMNDGGLVPADAETTWERRFGDCKGKTALLLAILQKLGITAQPALVNATGEGNGLDEHLPMIGLFNHVLVRATIGGRVYWLDGTRTGDGDIDTIRTPNFEWALPVQPAGAALVQLVPAQLDQPDTDQVLRLDASAGLSQPSPAHAETLFRGDLGLGLNIQLAQLTGDTLDAALRKYWREQYNFIDVKSVSASYDAATHTEKLAMDGSAKMDWSSSQYETDGTGVGYRADFTRSPGPDADAPFAVPFPSYSRVTETIVLPNQGAGFTFSSGADVDQTVAGIAYKRKAAIAKGVATIVSSQQTVAREFPAKDAPAAQEALRALAKQTLYVDEPDDYQTTPQEIAAQLSTTPTTADGFISRGNLLMNAKRYDAAVADFDKAVALDPKSAWGYANRGLAHFYQLQYSLAEEDYNKAAAIDPDNFVLAHGHGLMALQLQDLPAAIAAFGKAISTNPKDSFALYWRASAAAAAGQYPLVIADTTALIAEGKNTAYAYQMRAQAEYRTGAIDKALADADQAIALEPHAMDAYLLRTNVYRRKGDKAHALEQAPAIVAANPDSDYAHTTAGAIYAAYDEQDKAMAEFGKAIALKPQPSAYLTRMNARPKTDLAGRKADADAALKLAPNLPEALAAEAQVDEESGKYAEAVGMLSHALERAPHDITLVAERGMAHAHAGEEALAEKDYAAARAGAPDPMTLNNWCWRKATTGISLASALTDCDAALAKMPQEPALLDSRAFVLLRLGRYSESIAQYDKALAGRPDQASSLYGRAVAKARSGDKAGADRDAAAATKAQASIVKEFAGYGVGLDAAPAATSAATATATASAAK